MSNRPPMMLLRMQRAIVLCDLIIEDLNSADLDIDVHKAVTELHRVVIRKHQQIQREKQEWLRTHTQS